jgi:hypothetical protein
MQRQVYIAWVCAMAACGRVGFEPRVTSDAGVPRDAPSDVTPDALEVGPCAGPTIFDDTFGDGAAGPLFFSPATAAEITVTETGGEILFDLAGPVTTRGYGVYRSVASYPLAGLCVVIDVSRLVTCAECGTFLKLFDSTTAAEHFAYSFEGRLWLAMRTHINATDGAGTIDHFHNIELDLAAERFWRIEQVGNLTYWDTSADGVRYQRHTEVSDLFVDPAVVVSFGAGTEAPVTNGGIAAFQQVTAYGP